MPLMTAEAEITGPQRKYLSSLVKERDWSLADMKTVRVAKIVSRPDENGNLITFVSKKDASYTIDKLLKCSKIVVAAAAAPATTTTPPPPPTPPNLLGRRSRHKRSSC